MNYLRRLWVLINNPFLLLAATFIFTLLTICISRFSSVGRAQVDITEERAQAAVRLQRGQTLVAAPNGNPFGSSTLINTHSQLDDATGILLGLTAYWVSLQATRQPTPDIDSFLQGAIKAGVLPADRLRPGPARSGSLLAETADFLVRFRPFPFGLEVIVAPHRNQNAVPLLVRFPADAYPIDEARNPSLKGKVPYSLYGYDGHEYPIPSPPPFLPVELLEERNWVRQPVTPNPLTDDQRRLLESYRQSGPNNQ